MTFDLDRRTVALSVGEFAGFTSGPRDRGTGGAAGLWRAQLGTHWHQQLRGQATRDHAEAASFEVPITGQIVHRGWTFTLTGRIDQLLRQPGGAVLREIKSVTSALPADESELRSVHPDYFIQLATYATLARLGLARTPGGAAPSPPGAATPPGRHRLCPRRPGRSSCSSRSDRVWFKPSCSPPATRRSSASSSPASPNFSISELRARERLRGLRSAPAFRHPPPRPGDHAGDLTACFERQPLVLFEAPTGFGKTGVLLEFALGQLRSGHFDRALYLTSKSTGQLQVVRTLAAMTGLSRHRPEAH
jgi:DNA excision repair protein ERCC-2